MTNPFKMGKVSSILLICCLNILNSLKEKELYILSDKMTLSELPVDVLSRITSYCISEQWQMKMKHNNSLKAIQTKYKYKITQRLL